MEDEPIMSKLTMREYSAGFILLSFTVAATLSFSGTLFDTYSSQLTGDNKDTVNKLNRQINQSSPDIANKEEKVNQISTESDTFFLGSVLTVIQTVTDGITSLPSIAQILISGLNLNKDIILLASIPVVAIIWEVVSLYRGLRT